MFFRRFHQRGSPAEDAYSLPRKPPEFLLDTDGDTGDTANQYQIPSEILYLLKSVKWGIFIRGFIRSIVLLGSSVISKDRFFLNYANHWKVKKSLLVLISSASVMLMIVYMSYKKVFYTCSSPMKYAYPDRFDEISSYILETS